MASRVTMPKIEDGKKVLAKQCLELTDQALEAIQCPACFETSESYFQCTVGHHICKTCYNKVDNSCPTCRAPLSKTRCFVIEDLRKNFDSMHNSLKNLDLSLNTPESQKILEYRNLIRTILIQYSNFLGDSQNMLSFLNEYVKNPYERDLYAMERKVNFMNSQMLSVERFLKDTEQTLLNLKK